MLYRAFLLLLWLGSGLTAWAQEGPLRDFDPDTIRVLYFSYERGSENLSADADYKGVAVRTIVDSVGGYEDRMTDVQSKQLLFRVKHEANAGHATLLMYYPNGELRLSAQFSDDSTSKFPVAFFVPSLRRPLSAYVLLDGDLTTYYPDGAIRQQARYHQGVRVKSQCL